MRVLGQRAPFPVRYTEDDIDIDRPEVVSIESDAGVDSADAGRMRDINRVLMVARLMAQRECTMLDLATELGVSTRTVRRYIYALSLAGFDIYQFRGARWGAASAYRLDRRSWHGFMHLPAD
jgi:AraC-like DNA-binding protein